MSDKRRKGSLWVCDKGDYLFVIKEYVNKMSAQRPLKEKANNTHSSGVL